LFFLKKNCCYPYPLLGVAQQSKRITPWQKIQVIPILGIKPIQKRIKKPFLAAHSQGVIPTLVGIATEVCHSTQANTNARH
jgi:hypothetical protein